MMGLRVMVLFGFVMFAYASRWESLFDYTSPNAINPAGTDRFSGTAQNNLHPGPGQPSSAPPSLSVSQQDPEPTAPGQRLTNHTGELRPRSHEPSPAVKQQPQVLVKYEQRVPVPADSVAVHCGEAEVTVEVKQNFMGNGQLIEPSDLTLGGCPAVNSTGHTLLYRAQLQDCGSTMTMSEEALVYTFLLLYSPTPIHDTFVVKTNPAEVTVECHYRRKQLVSSEDLKPTWRPYASHKLTQQELLFSLRLMTEDWRSERSDQAYYLDELMYVEASVLRGHHVPLRVHVESCVAALDPSFTPSYSFINNHGCLMDAKLTGANAYFLPRTQEDKLRFQMRTFRFPQDPRTTLYIICHLKATSVSVPIDAEHKACSFLTEANRWVASGGDNQVCACCETSCTEHRAARSLAEHTGLQWEGDLFLGPIVVLENPEEMESGPTMVLENPGSEEEMKSKPTGVQEDVGSGEGMGTFSEASPQRATQLQTHSAPTLTGVLGAVGAALGVVALVFMGAVLHRRRPDPSGHAVCT